MASVKSSEQNGINKKTQNKMASVKSLEQNGISKKLITKWH
jgi:hypothetical protein